MPTTQFAIQASVEVDGSALVDDVEPLLEQVVVDDYLHQPDMFVLCFRDVDRNVLSQAKLKIGSKVAIAASEAGGPPQKLIAGEVTSIEADYTVATSRAFVRGYDPSHRFQRGRRTATYCGKKDSDIARELAKSAQVDVGTIDETSQVHEHLSQANQSDWDFLKARAKEIGYEVVVDDGKFHFRKPAKSADAPGEADYSSEDPLQLVLGQELLEFRPRISSAQQVSSVEVRSWDPARKEALVGTAPANTTSTKLKATPSSVSGIFGSPKFVAVDRPLSTQAAVEAAAAAVSTTIGSAMAEAEGVARGNPKLRAGSPVSVSVVADDFVGGYTLTHTRHVFDHEGYRTSFFVSGALERSLLGLTTTAGGGNGTKTIAGLVPAIVTNNDDPEKVARVKLKFPWLSESYESDWARLVQLGAGPDSGAVFIPEVNDEVLVGFEFGDIRRPYVVGSLYNGKDKPKLGDGLLDNGNVKRRGFVSRKGSRLIFFDGDGDVGIALLSSDGKLKVALKETDREIHIYAGGTIKVEADQDISIKSSAGITVEASGQLSLKGSAGVKIEGANVDIDGTPITLN